MNKLQIIRNQISELSTLYDREQESIRLMAVTKGQPNHQIQKLLEAGHRLFGENRIQEAYTKWPMFQKQYSNLELHLIGHLQTNKVKDAVALFNVIETLDSFKLAEKLVNEEKKQNKKLIYYVEINIGEEKQKNGVLPQDFPLFIEKLKENYPLDIRGIMCIPPQNQDPSLYFKQMYQIANKYNLSVISMGMSDDYPQAIQFGSTLLRIGRALFN